jgi:predicted RNA-binding protein with PIN domain
MLGIFGLMKYLLDGYNILFRERDAKGSLEEQRIQLFEKLNLLANAAYLNFIVVLDAHQQSGDLERHHYFSLEIIYTDFDQTADDYIIEYVECLPLSKRNRMKVVSSDKTLMQKIRFERVEVMSVSDFFKEIERKAHSRLSKKTEPDQSIVHSKAKKSALPQLNDNTSWIALFENRSSQKELL